MNERDPIVITGIGLAAPNGSSRGEYRAALLQGRSGVVAFETRHLGIVPAGVCEFDEFQYQRASVRRKGTRAGSVAIYCARQALQDSQLDWPNVAVDRVGICLGITEHGNVETENQIHELGQYNNDLGTWSNYHNSRTVANNPAGEVSINLGITGPHLTIGAPCAAGNAELIQGAQLLTLGEIVVALAGGISESIRSFGIFASFHSQRALPRHADPTKASRPFDLNRNGIVVSEGGGVFVLDLFPCWSKGSMSGERGAAGIDRSSRRSNRLGIHPRSSHNWLSALGPTAVTSGPANGFTPACHRSELFGLAKNRLRASGVCRRAVASAGEQNPRRIES